jgi:mono/diheme cytochrome c family protein
LRASFVCSAGDFRAVQPILEKHCVGCHARGEIGPMPLVGSYAEALSGGRRQFGKP